MLTYLEIKEQTLPHVTELSRWLNLSDEQILEAYDWVTEVLYDYHRVYEPFPYIRRSDAEHFFDLWCENYFVDPAPAEPHDSWGRPLQEAT